MTKPMGDLTRAEQDAVIAEALRKLEPEVRGAMESDAIQQLREVLEDVTARELQARRGLHDEHGQYYPPNHESWRVLGTVRQELWIAQSNHAHALRHAAELEDSR